MKTENNEQMEQIKEHMLRHARDWDYADWILSQIRGGIWGKDGDVGFLKAGYAFAQLEEHIRSCKNAEDALQGNLSKIREEAREEKRKENDKKE